MNKTCNIHDDYILMALEEAKKSSPDVPVGALIVKDNKVIAISPNQKEKENDPTAHAEIVVIREAARLTKSWRLDNTTLYVTLEPCPMCAAAILYSRIPNIVFGAYDPMYGAMGSAIDMTNFINFKPKVIGGVQEEKCRELLTNFFKNRREEY